MTPLERGRIMLRDLGYSHRVLDVMPPEKVAATLKHHGYTVLAQAVRLSVKSDAEQVAQVEAFDAGAGAPQRQPMGSGPVKGSAVGGEVERGWTCQRHVGPCTCTNPWDETGRPAAPEAIIDALKAYGIDWPPQGAAPMGLKGTWGRSWGTVTRDGAGLVIEAQPGNGTRYRLSVTVDGSMVRTIAWHDVGWSAGDMCAADVWAAGEWLSATRNAPGRVDCEAIASIVDDALHAAGVLK